MQEIAEGLAFGIGGVVLVFVLAILAAIAIFLRYLRPLGWVLLVITIVLGLYLFT